MGITGVRFFDYIHRQRGVPATGSELHPVLAVEFPEAEHGRAEMRL